MADDPATGALVTAITADDRDRPVRIHPAAPSDALLPIGPEHRISAEGRSRPTRRPRRR
jgi:hypothetical protein